MGSNWDYLAFTCWVTEKTQRFMHLSEGDFILWGFEASIEAVRLNFLPG